jgi:hypothetical protein
MSEKVNLRPTDYSCPYGVDSQIYPIQPQHIDYCLYGLVMK